MYAVLQKDFKLNIIIIDRAITQRSASDPANGDSPVRGQGHQPFYRRQTSMPNQSPDSV
jgi:hypothetical protein